MFQTIILILLVSRQLTPLLSDEPVTGKQWDEWLIQQGLRTTMTTPDQALESENPLINAPVVLGNNPLCRETPDSGDIYGHISCILTYALYILVIASIVIYLWKKWKTAHEIRQNDSPINLDLIVDTLKTNGFPSNNQNTRSKSRNQPMV